MAVDLKNLQQRVISAAIIAPLVLLFIYAGGPGYDLVVALVTVLGLNEWLRLTDPEAGGDAIFFSYAALLLTIGVGAWYSTCMGTILGAVLVTALFFLVSDDRKDKAGWLAGAIPYMGGFALALFDLRATPEIGRGSVFFLFLVVWATDIGAFAVGRLIGGPKLAPVISPNKTWAGLGGGMVLALIIGYLTAWACGARHPWVGGIIALVLAGVAQGGDLFESWIKRRAGAKESGDLIPGHGGLLDRIDGLIFAAIFFALFQNLLGLDINWW